MCSAVDLCQGYCRGPEWQLSDGGLLEGPGALTRVLQELAIAHARDSLPELSAEGGSPEGALAFLHQPGPSSDTGNGWGRLRQPAWCPQEGFWSQGSTGHIPGFSVPGLCSPPHPSWRV